MFITLAYQWAKAIECAQPDLAKRISTCQNGFTGKILSYQIKETERWKEIELDTMRKIVACKFTQNKELYNLITTSGIEHFL